MRTLDMRHHDHLISTTEDQCLSTPNYLAGATEEMLVTDAQQGTSSVRDHPAAIDKKPVIRVSIDTLDLSGSPRISGENSEHIKMLEESHKQLPPILIHATTMRVLDGVHRVLAARARGEQDIAGVFFEGDEAAAFVEAVRVNVSLRKSCDGGCGVLRGRRLRHAGRDA